MKDQGRIRRKAVAAILTFALVVAMIPGAIVNTHAADVWGSFKLRLVSADGTQDLANNSLTLDKGADVYLKMSFSSTLDNVKGIKAELDFPSGQDLNTGGMELDSANGVKIGGWKPLNLESDVNSKMIELGVTASNGSVSSGDLLTIHLKVTTSIPKNVTVTLKNIKIFYKDNSVETGYDPAAITLTHKDAGHRELSISSSMGQGTDSIAAHLNNKFYVPINIDKNSGFAVLGLKVELPADSGIKLTDYELDSTAATGQFTTDKADTDYPFDSEGQVDSTGKTRTYTISYLNSEEVKTVGTFAKLYFTVPEEVTKQDGTVINENTITQKSAAELKGKITIKVDEVKKLGDMSLDKVEGNIAVNYRLAQVVPMGDVNDDGVVTLSDAALIWQAYNGYITLTEEQIARAQVGEYVMELDKSVDRTKYPICTNDVMAIIRYYNQGRTKWPEKDIANNKYDWSVTSGSAISAAP